MASHYSIALVGDYDPSVPAHQAIPVAIDLAKRFLSAEINADWIATSRIQNAGSDLAGYHGVWCVPASPYQNMQGALDAIRYARENNIPFLGTCGGFQHALIEYARNVLNIKDAAHAETDPEAANPVVTNLTCSLVEKKGDLFFTPDSLIARSYGALMANEGYRCSYGPNPKYEKTLFGTQLRVTARDATGEVRAAELQGHPFFVGTLFQPERRALTGELPPLVRDYVGSMVQTSKVNAV